MIETPADLGTLFAIELKVEQCFKTFLTNDLQLEKIQILDGDCQYEFEYDNFIAVSESSRECFKKFILLEKSAQF